MSETTLKTVEARKSLYGSFPTAFQQPSRELLKENFTREIKKSLKRLSLHFLLDDAEELKAKDLYELTLEYNRLFYGPGRLLAPPYESIYREGRRVYGNCTVAVAEEYASVGVTISEDFHHPPDHIAAELEFMYFLITREIEARESGNADKERFFREKQRTFLREHLIQWIAPFSDSIIEATKEQFYYSLSKITLAFILSDFFRITGNISLKSIPKSVIEYSNYLLDRESQWKLNNNTKEGKRILLLHHSDKNITDLNIISQRVLHKGQFSVFSIIRAIDIGFDGVILKGEPDVMPAIVDTKNLLNALGIESESISFVSSEDDINKEIKRIRFLCKNPLKDLSPSELKTYDTIELLKGFSEKTDMIPAEDLAVNTIPCGTVEIAPERCTLCRGCAVRCRDHALVVKSQGGKLRLIFRQANCTGCGECEKSCLTKAIKVKSGLLNIKAVREATERLLAEEKAVICSYCSLPFISLKEHNILLRRNSQKGYKKYLLLCPRCRGL